MRIFIIVVLVAMQSLAFSQTRAKDSLELQKTIQWLEKQLTITYFNVDDREWWVNDFSYNPKNHYVLIKNTATDKLGKAGGKTYLQRSFFLSDMNPYTISAEPITANAGRMVVGNSIRVGVYKHARKVEQSKNGIGATSQSSVYFSVPKSMEDSVKGISQNIITELKKAISLATKVYTASDRATQLKTLLSDQFEGDVNWEVTTLFDNTVMVQEGKEDVYSRLLFFRLENSGAQLTLIDSRGTSEVIQLTYNPAIPGLIGENFTLNFENKNELHLSQGGNTQILTRASGFAGEAQNR